MTEGRSAVVPAGAVKRLGRGGAKRLAVAVFCAAFLSFLPAAHAESRTPELHFTTNAVEDLLVLEGALFVASRGGVERYEPLPASRRETRSRWVRTRHWTSEHGLDSPHVLRLAKVGRTLVVSTKTSDCVWQRAAERFRCELAPRKLGAIPSALGDFHGFRVTRRLGTRSGTWIGTAGGGVWRDGSPPERLTPTGQLCDDHVKAVVEHAGRLYVGGFNHGLCLLDGKRFVPVPTPFRMVNALLSTDGELFVASAEGVFRSTDGRGFSRIDWIDQRGANGLAFDGRSLWVTTPGALWRVRVKQGPADRVFWKPGGARSLQSVAVGNGAVWISSEDRGVIRWKEGAFEVFDRTRGLPSSWVLSADVTPDGTLYAGTLRDGVVAIHPDGSVRQVAGFEESWVLSVKTIGSTLWVGTQNGAARLEDGKLSWLSGLPDPRVHALLSTASGLYAGTELGLARFEKSALAPR